MFICRDWKPATTDSSGWPCNTEEMHPCWFPIGRFNPNEDKQSALDLSSIPFKHMWPDDQIWLYRVLSGDQILAWVHCVPFSLAGSAQPGTIADSARETNGLSIDPFEIPLYRLQRFPPNSEQVNILPQFRVVLF